MLIDFGKTYSVRSVKCGKITVIYLNLSLSCVKLLTVTTHELERQNSGS